MVVEDQKSGDRVSRRPKPPIWTSTGEGVVSHRRSGLSHLSPFPELNRVVSHSGLQWFSSSLRVTVEGFGDR